MRQISVSVCIPTYNRPEMLAHCLHSVFSQSIRAKEIIIGDDSSDNRTEKLIESLSVPVGVSLIYQHNTPSLGQARNVQALFEAASGDWLLLIHDDDWLVPDALKHLTEPIMVDDKIDAVYGNQLVAEADGTINPGKTRSLNPAWHRTPKWTGKQANALLSAALGQFPNNGWIVRRTLALKAGYVEKGVEDACDFAFGLKLALKGGSFYYQPEDIAVYRLSPVSVSRGRPSRNSAAIDAARLLWRHRHIVPDTPEMRERFRSCFYQAAVWCGLHRCHRLEALKWALHPRFGICWFGRAGAGVLSAMAFPDLRDKFKTYTIRRRFQA